MYIGIDLGTSGVKTILVDKNQKILSTAHTSLTVHSPKDGYNEQHPKDWILAIEKCLENLRKKNPLEFSSTMKTILFCFSIISNVFSVI